MEYKKIDVLEHSREILTGIKGGALLMTEHEGRRNAMTISWGGLTIVWGKTCMEVYVRRSRYSKVLLDATGAFTVSIPHGEFDPKILSYCGSKSGRDGDKIAALGLTPTEAQTNGVAGTRELKINIECRVICAREQTIETLDQWIIDRFYPAGGSSHAMADDYHTVYCGEVVDAYVVE